MNPDRAQAALRALEAPTTEAELLRFRSPEELRTASPEEYEFVWDGYLAPGAVTLLAGKAKSGKSTLAFALVAAMVTGAGTFLDRGLSAGPVVYVSEEGDQTVRPKLPPDGTPLRMLTRSAAWPKPTWPELIAAAVAEAKRADARLLVIDTLTFWSDLKADQEKDAGATKATMDALVSAANADLAVLLVHHQRKAGGEGGDAIRGSGAIVSAVELFMELERPTDAPARQRQLIALGRWPAPGMLLIERDAATGGWRVIGEGDGREDASKIGWRDRLLAALPTAEPGATYGDLAEELGAEKPKWYPTLMELLTEGLADRSGEGKRGSPYCFTKAVLENRPLSRTETDGNGNEAFPSHPSSPRRGGGDGIEPTETSSLLDEDGNGRLGPDGLVDPLPLAAQNIGRAES